MAKSLPLLAAGLLTAAAIAAPALALDPATKAPIRRDCFNLSDWNGWSAPDKNTVLLRVRHRDVYRLDLAYGSNQLTSPSSHLVSVARGANRVCQPLDLDLRVADSFDPLGGVPIRARTITKLTAEEIAALPKKHRP
ncbi:hypothetical protein CSW58_01995 [Caulobacter sp. B11]|uniref:DUF6491 family protein n=1 Tax=Caulobacter sp. B11 TaxID=2048899 RepID=UPI000C12D644|nr:DUF6491 family protein [Caulobacter sp. B11]PHY14004.1 hypothetical protein CSW58_01995 [Caulobacter sp. B11]